jgi:FemAB-related protein (PEP-CTERM system-associated)
MIRRAIRNGLTTRIDGDVAPLHDLYAHTARRFGTPVFPLRFFEALLRRFPEEAMVLTVRHGATPVAAALTLMFDGTIQPYYAGSRSDCFHYAVNDFLYWELMRAGTARGARLFDFGRSKIGSGAFEYKRLWGFDAEPMQYRVATLGASAPPQRSSDDPRLDLAQRMWRRLPLAVTKLLGPFFVARYGPYFT